MTKVLDVYLHEMLAGKLRQDTQGKLSFEYNADYLKNPKSRPLSIAMPLQTQAYDDEISQAFFGGLLPEENIRQRLAKNLKISVGNTFKLLEIIGGECAGAVALYPEKQRPEKPNDGFVLLNEEKLEEVLINLRPHPFLADTSNFRLSLAGAQDKLPVLMIENNIAIPQKLPSSHILKIPINSPDLEINESVHNEFFCMQLARILLISVPNTEIKWCKQIPFLLIQRYDRLIALHENMTSTLDPGCIVYGSHYIKRFHQEDFCQAMHLPPYMKYQNESGPSISQCIELIKKNSQRPAADQKEFIRRIIFNYLIGNADAHGKNFSFLYVDKKPTLSPAYDLLSTAVYPKVTNKMAMKIGSQYEPDRVYLRHWYSLVETTATSREMLEVYLQFFAKSIPDVAVLLRKKLQAQGISSPIFDKIQAVINKRAKHIMKYFSSRKE